MVSQPAKIALFGAGLIGREHAALLFRNPATELVAIVDPAEAAKSVANQYGARHYCDAVTMFDDKRPDALLSRCRMLSTPPL